MLLDRQTYQGYPRCNLTNGSVSGQISGGFTIQPSMPVLPFIEKLSICFEHWSNFLIQSLHNN